MAGENDGAMFYFDTNIDNVAADIAGALQRINAELAQPLRAPALAANTAELGQLGTRLEQQARAGMDRMRAALASGMDPREAFRQNISETFGAIPRIMADEMAKVPTTVAMSTPVGKLASEAGRAYVNELRSTIARESPRAFEAIKGTRFPVNQLRSLERAPAAFGSSDLDPRSYYTAQARAEAIIRKDFDAGGGGLSRNAMAQAELAGYTRKYMEALHKATVVMETVGETTDAVFRPTDAQARLRDLGPTNEATARRMDAARTQTQTGQMLRSAGGGDIVGAYRVLAGEVYRVTTLGAQRVENELVVEQVLARQRRQIEQQAAAAERLNRREATAGARQDASMGGFAGGFASRFARGGGGMMNALGGQVASAASFSLGYGTLFGVIGGLKDIETEFMDYQDSLTDFQVATGDANAVTGDWIDSLGELSRITGENLGASLDTAARGVRAFGNPLTDTLEKTRAISEATNTAATQLGLVANKALPDATGDTLAVGTAFGMQPDQLQQIVDAVANAKRSLGGDPGQISQGLASIATSAQAAGYNLNQAASLISLVQSRTDETGLAAATRLTRIFQTVSGSTGKKLGQELNVNTDQSARQQLEAYSRIYNAPDTTKAVRDRITSALGGTANLRELLPVLQEGTRLTESYAAAQANAGQGQSEFERKSDNLVGTLKKIRGDIKLLEVDLVRSDIFAPFGILVNTLEPVLHLLDRALQLFDRMPEPIRQITAALVDLAIAAKGVAVVQNVMATRQAGRRAEAGLVQAIPTITGGRIARGSAGVVAPAALERSAGAAGANAAMQARNAEAARLAEAMQARMAAEAALTEGVAGAGAARREAEAVQPPLILQSAEARRAAAQAEIAGILDAIPPRLAAEAELDATVATSAEARAATEVGSTATRTAGALGGLGAIARSLVSPWTIAIGALVGGAVILNKYFDGIQQRAKFEAQYADTSFALARNTGTAEDTRRAAQDLRSVAGTMRKSDASTNEAKDTRRGLSRQLDQQADDLDAIGRRVAREEAANARAGSTSVFGQGGVVTTVDELATGLQKLQENGAGAYGQMVALNKELRNTASPQRQSYQPEQFASHMSTAALARLRGFMPDQVEVPDRGVHLQVDPRTGQAYQTHFEETKLVSANAAYARVAKDNPQARIDQYVQDAAASLGIEQGDVLTTRQQVQIARIVADKFDLSSVPKNARQLRSELFQYLYRQAADIPDTQGGNLLDYGINGVLNGIVAASPKRRSRTLNGRGALTADQALSIVQAGEPNADGSQKPALTDIYSNALSEIPADDDGSQRLRALRGQYNTWKMIVGRIRKSGDRVPREIAYDVRNAQDTYAEAKINQLEDLRKVAQSDAAGDPTRQKQVGQDFLQREITAAGTNGKRLRSIMENANQQMLALVRATLVEAERMAKEAADEAGVNDIPQSPLTNPTYYKPSIGPDGQTGPAAASPAARTLSRRQRAAQQKYRDARARRRAFDRSEAQTNVPETGGNFATAGDTADVDKLTAAQLAALRRRSQVNPTDTVGAAAADLAVSKANLSRAAADFDTGKITQQDLYAAQQDVNEKRQAYLQSQVDLASAAASARAARTGGAMATARAQIQGAAAAMRINARGTVGWFQGLQQFYEGQEAMRQAVMAYRDNQDKLHGDITDPVENARDQLRADQRAMREARNKEDRAAAAVAVRQDRASLQDSKFQQRLSDMQTGEDLGRISFAKYMSYLDHEHDRLTRIHHRTRQQQDELDTVDKAMKDALSSMDSQFNLGDINTNGLVYQVRRFKAEMAGGGASPRMAASGNTYNSTLTITGADTAAVLRHVDRHLRINGGQRQSLTRRKV